MFLFIFMFGGFELLFLLTAGSYFSVLWVEEKEVAAVPTAGQDWTGVEKSCLNGAMVAPGLDICESGSVIE